MTSEARRRWLDDVQLLFIQGGDVAVTPSLKVTAYT